MTKTHEVVLYIVNFFTVIWYEHIGKTVTLLSDSKNRSCTLRRKRAVEHFLHQSLVEVAGARLLRQCIALQFILDLSLGLLYSNNASRYTEVYQLSH